MEIEVELADMPQMADNTMIIKYIIKNMAAQVGKTATFCRNRFTRKRAAACMSICCLQRTGTLYFMMKTGIPA